MKEIVHAKLRGVIGAMAMTGVRVFAQHAGLIREDPPSRLTRKKTGRKNRTVVELVHWAMGGVFGIGYGLLPERLRQRAWSGPAVRPARLGRLRRGRGSRPRPDRAQLAEGTRARRLHAPTTCSSGSC